MNKRKLLSLAKFLEKQVPEDNFTLGTWIWVWGRSSVNKKVCEADILGDKEETICGTTCCVAGWDVIRSGFCMNIYAEVFKSKRHKKPLKDEQTGKALDAYCFSRDNLGLDDREAHKLFLPEGWINSGKYFDYSPQGAAARIRYFVETGR